MSTEIPMEAVIVTTDAMESGDACDLLYSNMQVIDRHLVEHFKHEELSQDALRSYYVQYFYGEVQNGGFAQFVYNSGWGECVDYVAEGFAAIGAVKHL